MLSESGVFRKSKTDIHDDSDKGSVDEDGIRTGDIYAGMIGVVLAAVSTIGAVHSALSLPYEIRMCKYLLKIY